MHTMIKAALTAAFVVALAWPLLLWGKSASSAGTSRNFQQKTSQTSFVLWPQYDVVW